VQRARRGARQAIPMESRPGCTRRRSLSCAEEHYLEEGIMQPSTPPTGPQGDASALTDVATLRQRARQDIESGAVTPGYSANREEVIRLLNEALATEIVCYLRYKRHYFMADGIHSEAVAAEFLEHAVQEQEHADQIAERIVQLGGAPDFSPDSLTSRSHAQYVEGATLKDMIRENLVAERIAIDSYREIARYIGENDPTTRRLMESILATEEEHADDLVGLMRGLHE
jgi:bacterioferritin